MMFDKESVWYDGGGKLRDKPLLLGGLLGKELLVCPLCSEYYKDPRIFPCEHSFCRSCLQSYYDKVKVDSKANKKLLSFPCPKCQMEIVIPRSGISGFPLDAKVRQKKEQFIEALASSSSRSPSATASDPGVSDRTFSPPMSRTAPDLQSLLKEAQGHKVVDDENDAGESSPRSNRYSSKEKYSRPRGDYFETDFRPSPRARQNVTRSSSLRDRKSRVNVTFRDDHATYQSSEAFDPNKPEGYMFTPPSFEDTRAARFASRRLRRAPSPNCAYRRNHPEAKESVPLTSWSSTESLDNSSPRYRYSSRSSQPTSPQTTPKGEPPEDDLRAKVNDFLNMRRKDAARNNESSNPENTPGSKDYKESSRYGGENKENKDLFQDRSKADDQTPRKEIPKVSPRSSGREGRPRTMENYGSREDLDGATEPDNNTPWRKPRRARGDRARSGSGGSTEDLRSEGPKPRAPLRRARSDAARNPTKEAPKNSPAFRPASTENEGSRMRHAEPAPGPGEAATSSPQEPPLSPRLKAWESLSKKTSMPSPTPERRRSRLRTSASSRQAEGGKDGARLDNEQPVKDTAPPSSTSPASSSASTELQKEDCAIPLGYSSVKRSPANVAAANPTTATTPTAAADSTAADPACNSTDKTSETIGATAIPLGPVPNSASVPRSGGSSGISELDNSHIKHGANKTSGLSPGHAGPNDRQQPGAVQGQQAGPVHAKHVAADPAVGSYDTVDSSHQKPRDGDAGHAKKDPANHRIINPAAENEIPQAKRKTDSKRSGTVNGVASVREKFESKHMEPSSPRRKSRESATNAAKDQSEAKLKPTESTSKPRDNKAPDAAHVHSVHPQRRTTPEKAPHESTRPPQERKQPGRKPPDTAPQHSNKPTRKERPKESKFSSSSPPVSSPPTSPTHAKPTVVTAGGGPPPVKTRTANTQERVKQTTPTSHANMPAGSVSSTDKKNQPRGDKVQETSQASVHHAKPKMTRQHSSSSRSGSVTEDPQDWTTGNIIFDSRPVIDENSQPRSADGDHHRVDTELESEVPAGESATTTTHCDSGQNSADKQNAKVVAAEVRPEIDTEERPDRQDSATQQAETVGEDHVTVTSEPPPPSPGKRPASDQPLPPSPAGEAREPASPPRKHKPPPSSPTLKKEGASVASAEVESEISEQEQEQVEEEVIPRMDPIYIAREIWQQSKNEYEMPTSMAVVSLETAVVADYSTGRLDFLDNAGNNVHRFEGIKPFSISTNKASQVIVADRKDKTVKVFDEFGGDVLQWDSDKFKWLSGVAMTTNGTYVVYDREKYKVGLYTVGGERISEFGSFGSHDNQLCMADFIALDSNDRILLCDSGNHCIKIFDLNGNLISKFGKRGHRDGQLEWPKGICVDRRDNIIVADHCNRRVSMFSPDGVFMQHILIDWPAPYCVCYHESNLLGVTHYSLGGYSQIAVYALDDLPGSQATQPQADENSETT